MKAKAKRRPVDVPMPAGAKGETQATYTVPGSAVCDAWYAAKRGEGVVVMLLRGGQHGKVLGAAQFDRDGAKAFMAQLLALV